MSISSIVNAVASMFGFHFQNSRDHVAQAHSHWRDAIHLSRNEATKAIAAGAHATRVSSRTQESVEATIRLQEESGRRGAINDLLTQRDRRND